VSEVARLLCQAIELRAAAERAGGHMTTAAIFECAPDLIEQATPLGDRRRASNGTHEWDVVVLCGGVLTLASAHRPMDDNSRETMKMSALELAKGEGA
jgi:hypothetical protein